MRGPSSHGFWPVRDLPVVLWLLAAVVVALQPAFLPAPRWLLVHVLLLGALSHAILVWSRHFADALLHTAPSELDRRRQSRRLVLENLGALAVLTGVVRGRWPVTLAGATAVGTAVGWHGAALAQLLRRALPSRFGPTVRYYVAAACFLPVGAALGTALARGLDYPRDEQAALAHVAVNVLGWVGLTVVGTLVTLWPTMLRTRIAAGSERAARRALPLLAGAVVVTAGGALTGVRLLAALGLAGYLAGLGMVAGAFVTTARGKRPSSFPTWSVLAGVLWLIGCLSVLTVGVATAGSWAEVADRLDGVALFVAVGFGAQLLLGALSYLVPMVLGGGPTPVRAANAVVERAAAVRVGVTNAALLVCVLPVPTAVRDVCSALVLAALTSFLPLLLLAVRASRRASAERVPVG